MSCNESERALTGRVHTQVKATLDVHNGALTPGKIASMFSFNDVVIETAGTGRIDSFELTQFEPSSTIALTLDAFKILFTTRELTTLAVGDDIAFTDLSNDYSQLVAVEEIAGADWNEIITDKIARFEKRDFNANFKCIESDKRLHAYLIADGSYTVDSNIDFQLTLHITKD